MVTGADALSALEESMRGLNQVEREQSCGRSVLGMERA